jgi:hypothetical protein
MKRRLPILYWLIPLLYLVVIVYFLYAQFSAGQTFNLKVGTLVLSGVSSERTFFRPEGIDELTLRYESLEVSFSGKRPLILVTASGEEVRPAIRSYQTFPQGVQVQFDGGTLLRFTQTGELGDQVLIDPLLADTAARVTSLSFPLLVRSGTMERVRGIALLSFSGAGGQYFISLPDDAAFDVETQRITVRNLSEASGILIERAGQGEPDPYRYWFARGEQFADEPGYQRGLAAYLDRAYASWKIRAFSGGESLPRMELLGAAMLSEALKRGEYPELRVPFYQALLQLRAQGPEASLPARTTPYVGGLDLYYRQLQSSIPRRLEEITGRIQRSDTTVLQDPDLICFILNHGPFSLIEEIIRLADGVDNEAAPLPLLLSVADAYTQVSELIGPTGNSLPRITDIVENRLLPSIRRTDQGLFLPQDGTVSVRQNVDAGNILVRLGGILDRPAFLAIGQNILLSCLQLADSRGVLPARLALRAGRPEAPEGRILAEDIYSRIAPLRYTPREVPLYHSLGPGSWIWTASAATTTEIETASYRFTFRFPPGATHYLLIQGIKPFQGLQLHGTPWKSDPAYYRYSDGWVYDGATQSLILKLTHRDEVEELLIRYP